LIVGECEVSSGDGNTGHGGGGDEGGVCSTGDGDLAGIDVNGGLGGDGDGICNVRDAGDGGDALSAAAGENLLPTLIPLPLPLPLPLPCKPRTPLPRPTTGRMGTGCVRPIADDDLGCGGLPPRETERGSNRGDPAGD